MILGISGKIGTGKTTLTKNICIELGKLGMVASIRSFGDPVKLEAAEFFDFPVEWCYTEEGKDSAVETLLHHQMEFDLPEFMSVRQILQWYGTEYRRKQDPNYWVKKCMAVITPDIAMGLHVIIHDVRFPNEVSSIESRHGQCIRLEPYEGWTPGPHADHPSETALDKYNEWSYLARPAFGELHKVAESIALMMMPLKR